MNLNSTGFQSKQKHTICGFNDVFYIKQLGFRNYCEVLLLFVAGIERELSGSKSEKRKFKEEHLRKAKVP